jgi:hypothetical protein
LGSGPRGADRGGLRLIGFGAALERDLVGEEAIRSDFALRARDETFFFEGANDSARVRHVTP